MKRGLSKFHLMILLGIVFVISFIIVNASISDEPGEEWQVATGADGIIPLHRCYLDVKDHMATTDPEECGGVESENYEGILGYVYERSKFDSLDSDLKDKLIALQRCYALVPNNHMVTTDPEDCGGTISAGYEGVLGYIYERSKLDELDPEIRDNLVPLTRCRFERADGSPNHMSTIDPGVECKYGVEEGILGYLFSSLPGAEVPEETPPIAEPGTCKLKVVGEPEEVNGEDAGDGNDVLVSCNKAGPKYVPTGIRIIDFNDPVNMRPDKYKIQCHELICE